MHHWPHLFAPTSKGMQKVLKCKYIYAKCEYLTEDLYFLTEY